MLSLLSLCFVSPAAEEVALGMDEHVVFIDKVKELTDYSRVDYRPKLIPDSDVDKG
jgi:hypothetical protein